MFTNKEQLLYDAISEISDHIGHSIKNPISLSLLCLDLGISFEYISAISLIVLSCSIHLHHFFFLF